jgi:hypothetical protein
VGKRSVLTPLGGYAALCPSYNLRAIAAASKAVAARLGTERAIVVRTAPAEAAYDVSAGIVDIGLKS